MSAVARPEASCNWMSAMSCVVSYPTTVAEYVWPLPTSVALMSVSPWMTWLLVSTRPSELSTSPVAAPPDDV